QLGLRGFPAELHAGGAGMALTVIAHNQSAAPWRAVMPGESRRGTVSLAARWVPQGAETSSAGIGARLALPEDLPAGAERDYAMRLAPPDQPGNYRLRIEPFMEDVAWFGDAGGCKIE